MKYIKNKNYKKELEIYNAKSKKINTEYTNIKKFHTINNDIDFKTKRFSPWRKYASKKYYLLNYALPTLIMVLLTFSAMIVLNIVFKDTETIKIFGDIVIMIHSILFAGALAWNITFFVLMIYNKMKWEKILKDHNIIKPKKWLVDSKIQK